MVENNFSSFCLAQSYIRFSCLVFDDSFLQNFIQNMVVPASCLDCEGVAFRVPASRFLYVVSTRSDCVRQRLDTSGSLSVGARHLSHGF